MNHADAKRIACQNCGSGAIRSQVSLGFITDTCRDCRATFFNEAHLGELINETCSWCNGCGLENPQWGTLACHTCNGAGIVTERDEHAAIDRAIERDGDPDREHDSMEC